MIDEEYSLAKQGKRLPGEPLVRLLPKLKPRDSTAVSPQSRARLNQLLLVSPHKDLVLAILCAWEQIGDADALPAVEHLSKGGGTTGGTFEVRHAAAAALPAIRAAADRNAASITLLRGSAFTGEESTLLHTAGLPASTQATLLRIADSESEGEPPAAEQVIREGM